MEYIKATKSDTEEILIIVQDTIRTIYPRYYPQEVVDFFVSFIAEKIYPRISKLVLSAHCGLMVKLWEQAAIVTTILQGSMSNRNIRAGDMEVILCSALKMRLAQNTIRHI